MAFKWGRIAWCVLALPAAAQAQLYFRGDVGVSISTQANFHDNDPSQNLICGDPGCFSASRFSNFGAAPILSAGIGARLNRNARIDAVLGYRGYMLDHFDATDTEFRANVTSVSAMANAYYDFSGPGWAPYIGFGLGRSQNKIDTLSFDDGAAFFGSVPGGTTSSFAWAFMLGGSARLSRDTALDFGYRYIDLGKVEVPAGQVTVAGVVSPYPGASGNLRAHEFTVGVRF